MNYDQIIAAVAEHGTLSRDEADAATRATLEVLAERISHGEASDVAQRLPEEFGPELATKSAASPFDVEEFIHKVAGHEKTSPQRAQSHARAVMAVLQEAVGPEFHDVIAQLPEDYTAVLGRPT
jgi:uncharacterized protein (DUF2267 family)